MDPMSQATWKAIAVVSALVVLLAGIGYALTRSPDYRSSGALVLAPAVSDPASKAQLLQGYERSGTMGTFVHLVASADTFDRAGRPPVAIDARAVPSTRVIQVTAEGSEGAVQAGLQAVMASATASQGSLRDLWDLNVLESASPPEQAGPSTAVLIGGALLLALLSAVFTAVVLRRVADVERSWKAPGEDVELVTTEEEEPHAPVERERFLGSARK
jgi:hypothetical protein